MRHLLLLACRQLGCLAALLSLALPALGDEAAADHAAVTLRGFGTLGLASSSSDQAEFVRDLSQAHGPRAGRWSGRTDSLLGLQANWQASREIELVGQVVSRYRYDGSYRPELMWGFLSWAATPSLNLRAGRLGTDFFMLADSRLVGYSYLPVRPPTDYFGALPFSYIEGIDAVATLPVAGGILRGKLYGGFSREKAPLADRLWNLDGSRMLGGHLEFQLGAWQLRGSRATLRFKHDLPLEPLSTALALAAPTLPAAAAAADGLAVGGKESRFTSLETMYHRGPFTFQLMLSQIRQESLAFQDSRAAYLLVGYRLGKLTPYAGYSRVSSSPKPTVIGLPPQLDAAVAGIMADSHSNQHTVTVGLRWNVRDNTALKVQLDAIRGSPDSIFPYRWEQPGWNGRTRVVSAVVDFVF